MLSSQLAKFQKILVGILIIWNATLTLGNLLHCWKCQGTMHPSTHACRHLEFSDAELPSRLERCTKEEVCAKDVIIAEEFLRGSFVPIELVKRGCVKYDRNRSRERLGECFITELSPPYPSMRCLCNDSNYCNGSERSMALPNVSLITCLFFVATLCINLHKLLI